MLKYGGEEHSVAMKPHPPKEQSHLKSQHAHENDTNGTIASALRTFKVASNYGEKETSLIHLSHFVATQYEAVVAILGYSITLLCVKLD